jgi:hypothetical protein
VVQVLKVDGIREKWLGLGLLHAADALTEELSELPRRCAPPNPAV